jgi:hypothetical protein
MPHLLVMAFGTFPDPDILAVPGAGSALRLGRRILLREHGRIRAFLAGAG